MSDASLLHHLVDWIEGSYHQAGSLRNLHCFRVFQSVPSPEGGEVAAVSVRHQSAPAPGAPELYVVELWNLCHGPIKLSDVRAALLGLASYRAVYAQLLEEAEMKGLRRRHRLSVHANVMGTEVQPSTAVDLLSQHGAEVAFWTYRVRNGRMELDPFCGEGVAGPEAALAPMLDHLAWETAGSRARASETAGSDIPILATTR
jgi:hypothetical protein